MKIWTTEHVFNHNWETVTMSQWRKYPNPHHTAILGSDVMWRKVGSDGVLRSHRILISENQAPTWVTRLVGASTECLAHEYSTVDSKNRRMEMSSINLTFCTILSMRERMAYYPHPDFPNTKTIMRQETEVAVMGVPLTDYLESTIVNMCSNNSRKGRAAMDWVMEKLSCDTRNVSASLEKLKDEVVSLTGSVAENIVFTAKKSIEDLQRKHLLQAQELPAVTKLDEPL